MKNTNCRKSRAPQRARLRVRREERPSLWGKSYTGAVAAPNVGSKGLAPDLASFSVFAMAMK